MQNILVVDVIWWVPAGITFVGILFGVLGLWGLGIALFALCTLLVFIMIGSAIMGTSRQ